MTRNFRPNADAINRRVTEILQPKPVFIPQPIQPPVQFRGEKILFGVGAVAVGLLATANTWDDKVGRYRNGTGNLPPACLVNLTFQSSWI